MSDETTLPPEPPADGGDPPGPTSPPVNIEDEVRSSFLAYSMSVIISRALPDVRDGLKPVHRRILYAMQQEGLLSTRGYSKSAGVVGEVLKHYHPHGDSAVYDSMVRMAQDFSLRYPLVDGQGNFGSIDGDSAAAYRYTEARLTRLAEEMLRDIDRETVDFVPNFDGGMTEPVVLPTRFPNLLANGSSGIAVGMATNIPPHNLRELVDALKLVVAEPDCTLDDLLEKLPGPDFPTGAVICGSEGIRSAYATGRGLLTVRARADFEQHKKRGERIVVTEIPFMVNKATLQERIAELVKDGKIDGVSDIRDESNREGIRVVIELKKDAPGEVVLNQLYKQTPLQSTFGVNLLALVNGRPQTLSLKETLQHYVDFRREVVVRRATYDLAQAEARAHLLEGYAIALDHLDEVISIIRESQDTASARAHADRALRSLRAPGQRHPRDAAAAADGDGAAERPRRARGSAREDRRLEGSAGERRAHPRGGGGGARRGSARSTATIAAPRLGPAVEGLSTEDLIVEEDMVVTVSHLGYIQAQPAHPVPRAEARRQGREGDGGRAIRISSIASSWPRPTPTSSSSPRAAAPIG